MKLSTILLNEAIDTPEKIETWLRQMGVKNFTINPDHTVDVDGSVSLFKKGISKLPVKFNKINGDFLMRHNSLSSITNFPTEINGDCSVSHNPPLRNLKGGDSIKITGRLFCKETGLNTLDGFSDSFSEIGEKIDPNVATFEIDSSYSSYHFIKSGGIGLMLVKGARMDISKNNNENFPQAYRIIEKYLGQSDKVFECQNELIEAGFERYSSL